MASLVASSLSSWKVTDEWGVVADTCCAVGATVQAVACCAGMGRGVIGGELAGAVNVADEWGVEAGACCAVGAAVLVVGRCAVGVVRFVR